MEPARELDEKCPYCSGYGVALLADNGMLVKVGEILVNRQLKWTRCPFCYRQRDGSLPTPESSHVFGGVEAKT
jgi:hypothetical protein